MFTFKDFLNLIAGELFTNMTPDRLTNSLQLMICMIGSNPFLS